MSDLIYLGLGDMLHVKKTQSAEVFLAVSRCRHVRLDINHLLSCLNAEAVAEWCVDVPPC